MGNYFLWAFLFWIIISPASATDKRKKLKVFKGTFVSVQSGDYTHLKLKGADEKIASFVCDDLPKSEVLGIDCYDLQANQPKFIGKKFSVSYYEERSHIKEAGKSILWKYIKRIDPE
jgi:hypothetical protein